MKHQGLIVRRLLVTEKASSLAEARNQYFFEVAPAANKLEIKQAVETLYKVKVRRVNTMNYAGKMRRRRTVQAGQRPDWKRAVVTLHTGQKIELA